MLCDVYITHIFIYILLKIIFYAIYYDHGFLSAHSSQTLPTSRPTSPTLTLENKHKEIKIAEIL